MNSKSWLFVSLIAWAGTGLQAQGDLSVPFPGETTVVLDIGFGTRFVPPAYVTLAPGEKLQVNAPAAMRDMALQWYKDGAALPNATGPTLVLSPLAAGDAATYFCSDVTTRQGSQTLRLDVQMPNRLINLSTRGFTAPGEQTLISGFIVQGLREKKILIRALGPALTKYGVSGVLAEPEIRIFDSAGKPYYNGYYYAAVEGGMTHTKHIEQSTLAVGAVPLPSGGKDAVELQAFPPGAYTVHVTGKNNSSGITLLEVYEVPGQP